MKRDDGPPSHIAQQALRELAMPPFARASQRAMHDAIPEIRGQERWMAFRLPAR